MACREPSWPEYRGQVRARLAETQAALLTPLLGLSAPQLTSSWHATDQSPLGILLEQANADTEATVVLRAFLRDEATRAAGSDLGIAVGVSGAITRFLAARRLLLDTMARLSDDDWRRPTANGATPVEIMERRYIDAARRAEELAGSVPRRAPSFGPPDLLRAGLRAARKELLTTIALIPENRRPTYCLSDASSLLTHLSILTSRDRELLTESDLAPKATDWHTAWRDLHATRQRLLATLEALADENLGAPADRYEDIRQLVDADRTLAAALRASLQPRHRIEPDLFSP